MERQTIYKPKREKEEHMIIKKEGKWCMVNKRKDEEIRES